MSKGIVEDAGKAQGSRFKVQAALGGQARCAGQDRCGRAWTAQDRAGTRINALKSVQVCRKPVNPGARWRVRARSARIRVVGRRGGRRDGIGSGRSGQGMSGAGVCVRLIRPSGDGRRGGGGRRREGMERRRRGKVRRRADFPAAGTGAGVAGRERGLAGRESVLAGEENTVAGTEKGLGRERELGPRKGYICLYRMILCGISLVPFAAAGLSGRPGGAVRSPLQ